MHLCTKNIKYSVQKYAIWNTPAELWAVSLQEKMTLDFICWNPPLHILIYISFPAANIQTDVPTVVVWLTCASSHRLLHWIMAGLELRKAPADAPWRSPSVKPIPGANRSRGGWSLTPDLTGLGSTLFMECFDSQRDFARLGLGGGDRRSEPSVNFRAWISALTKWK